MKIMALSPCHFNAVPRCNIWGDCQKACIYPI